MNHKVFVLPCTHEAVASPGFNVLRSRLRFPDRFPDRNLGCVQFSLVPQKSMSNLGLVLSSTSPLQGEYTTAATQHLSDMWLSGSGPMHHITRSCHIKRSFRFAAHIAVRMP